MTDSKAGTGGRTREELLDILCAYPSGRRVIVAVAGAPASGKSHLADWFEAGINNRTPGRAAVLPMDGYHLDDRVLTEIGRIARKGAPDTFDVGGLAHMLGRLRDNSESKIAVPVFDREIEISRAGARLIPQSVEIIIAEGNYLLLDDAPWSSLRPYFDTSVFLDIPEDELVRRLRQRWVGYGLDEEAIRRKIEDNDLPNGQLVARRSSGADFVLGG